MSVVSRKQRFLRLLLITGLVTTAGCSVPRDQKARVIARSAIPTFLQNQVRPLNIYLTRYARLTPVKKSVPLSLSREATVTALISRLREPLTAEERKGFYESELAHRAKSVQELDVKLTSVAEDLVTLDITNAFDIENNPSALGQLVLTITDVPGFRRVDFMRGGIRLRQVRTSYDPTHNLTATPVRGSSFDQPIATETGTLYFVANGKLRPVETSFDGGELSDTPLYTAQRYLAALQIPPDGYSTMVPFDATITEDGLRNFVLSFGAGYNTLSSTNKALAVGQIVQSLRIAAQITKLPVMVLVVSGKTVGTLDPDAYTALVGSVISDLVDTAGSVTTTLN